MGLSVVIAGAGAAGLWSALALLRQGLAGQALTLVDPDRKTENDRTWSYWAKAPLLPIEHMYHEVFDELVLRTPHRELVLPMQPYQYFSTRSSDFYAYAKQVLAKAGATWIQAAVEEVQESSTGVLVELDNGEQLHADYVLDSRPLKVSLDRAPVIATLQHFGGWYLESEQPMFDPDQVVFMDFADFGEEVGFYYVIPLGPKAAMVELAIFGKTVWDRRCYDEYLRTYLSQHGHSEYTISEREYGVIPMTDEALWRTSTSRVWAIGTRGGWVQPSSGYAFTRIAHFAQETAALLLSPKPAPWRPKPLQQIFNSVMLGHVLDHPDQAGDTFYNLFAKNGVERTFDFLDEQASAVDTLKLMWTCPKGAFTQRFVNEVSSRLRGLK